MSLKSKKLDIATKFKEFGSHQEQRPKRKDCMGRCVLCLLIQAVFIFGVFLAFLIGHWASEVEFGNDVSFFINSETLDTFFGFLKCYVFFVLFLLTKNTKLFLLSFYHPKNHSFLSPPTLN